MIAFSNDDMARYTDLARRELLRASARLSGQDGIPGTAAEGQLIRPLVALAGLEGEEPTPAFWNGVLAVQLAHEASLLHDDVIDLAGTRRGRPTVATERGVARALLEGDHLLTAAYRAAAMTESLGFVTRFARAVERTVAGETAQGRASGRELDFSDYESIVLGKSGELLGCALSASATISGKPQADSLFELGRRVGVLYQMLDDLLDYSPLSNTGKDPLGDYGSGRWTWVLAHHPDLPFGLPREEVLGRLWGSADRVAAERCRRQIADYGGRLLDDVAQALPGDAHLGSMLRGWLARAEEAIEREVTARPNRAIADRAGFRHDPEDAGPTRAARDADIIRVLAERLPARADTTQFFATNSRTFRFASRFFRDEDARRIATVYAYCRVTDDLVDRPSADVTPGELLDAWEDLSRRAYLGEVTGFSVLDDAMREMSARSVPFDYAAELIEGMRMDLRGQRYASMRDLDRYTYRVASVVGLWIARLAGCHHPAILDRASRMGRAMQMTNILRDVGEDLRVGRLYLPAEELERYEVTERGLRDAEAGGPLPAGYSELMEALLTDAERDYALALEAVPELPPGFARPVAVAAHLYRGIHREIRRNGYDNLRHRAFTRSTTKCVLAAVALWRLRTVRPQPLAGPAPAVPVTLIGRR